MRKRAIVLGLSVFAILITACGAGDTSAGHIIYQTGSGLQAEWWSIQPDGANEVRIEIPPSRYIVTPNPSLDFILFLNYENSYVANSDGSNPQELSLPGGNQNWEWSPNGREVLSFEWQSPTYLVDLVTVEVKEISSWDYGGNSFSPDGEWIAYHTDDGVALMGPDRANARLIAEKADIMGFTPDSCEVVYIEHEDESDVLYIDKVEASERRELARSEWIRGIDLVPNQRLALVEVRGEAGGLAAIDLDSSQQLWVVDDLTASNFDSAAVSPTGTSLLLIDIDVDDAMLYAIDVGSGDTNVLHRIQGDMAYDISFSPNGSYALVVSAYRISAHVVDLRSSTVMNLLIPDEIARDQPLLSHFEWSSTSQDLLFTIWDQAENVQTAYLYRTADASVEKLGSGSFAVGVFSPDGSQIALNVMTAIEGQGPSSDIYLLDTARLEHSLFLEDASIVAWAR
ncbi:MAG: hypothetical protein PVF70_06815 [Anaerolineales bacterium]